MHGLGTDKTHIFWHSLAQFRHSIVTPQAQLKVTTYCRHSLIKNSLQKPKENIIYTQQRKQYLEHFPCIVLTAFSK